jgi:hypothetical protein
MTNLVVIITQLLTNPICKKARKHEKVMTAKVNIIIPKCHLHFLTKSTIITCINLLINSFEFFIHKVFKFNTENKFVNAIDSNIFSAYVN